MYAPVPDRSHSSIIRNVIPAVDADGQTGEAACSLGHIGLNFDRMLPL